MKHSTFALLLTLAMAVSARAADVALRVETPMTPPAWALLERELLKAKRPPARSSSRKYFDERG